MLVWMVAAACGESAPESVRVTDGPAPIESGLPQVGARDDHFDWERPGGALAKTTTLERAKADGQLPFDIPPLRMPGRPAVVVVADPLAVPAPMRSVYVMYRMPRSADFPEDGRIALIMKPTESTAQTLRDMAAHNKPEGSHVLVTIRNAEVLLVQNEQRSSGYVTYSKDGVLYKVVGPRLTPAAARKYAELLLPI